MLCRHICTVTVCIVIGLYRECRVHSQISSQWKSQKNRFVFIVFSKIQFLPPCIWDLSFHVVLPQWSFIRLYSCCNEGLRQDLQGVPTSLTGKLPTLVVFYLTSKMYRHASPELIEETGGGEVWKAWGTRGFSPVCIISWCKQVLLIVQQIKKKHIGCFPEQSLLRPGSDIITVL
jgi:hypothetical protein